MKTKTELKDDNRHTLSRKLKYYSSYLLIKIEALFWVGLSLIVLLKTNFIKVLLHSHKCSPLFRKLYLICTGISVSIIMNETIIQKLYPSKNRSMAIENKMILLTNIFVIFAGIFCIVTVWGVYGWLSLLMIPLFGMGLLFMTHFVPFKGILNTFLIYLVLLAVLVYGYLKDDDF